MLQKKIIKSSSKDMVRTDLLVLAQEMLRLKLLK